MGPVRQREMPGGVLQWAHEICPRGAWINHREELPLYFQAGLRACLPKRTMHTHQLGISSGVSVRPGIIRKGSGPRYIACTACMPSTSCAQANARVVSGYHLQRWMPDRPAPIERDAVKKLSITKQVDGCGFRTKYVF